MQETEGIKRFADPDSTFAQWVVLLESLESTVNWNNVRALAVIDAVRNFVVQRITCFETCRVKTFPRLHYLFLEFI